MENQIDSIHQKALIRYLNVCRKTNNLVMDNKRWQKKVERRNRKMTIDGCDQEDVFTIKLHGILVLDDRNNYESQWTNRLVLVDYFCRTSVWNT